MAAKESKSAAGASLNFGQNVKRMQCGQRRPRSGQLAAQRRRQPISDGVRSAINELWPGGIPADLMAKERGEKIIEWLKEKTKNISKNLSRTIQRVLESE
jgi:hypothetical protein